MVIFLPDGKVKRNSDGKTGKVKVKKILDHCYCKDCGIMFKPVKENE